MSNRNPPRVVPEDTYTDAQSGESVTEIDIGNQVAEIVFGDDGPVTESSEVTSIEEEDDGTTVTIMRGSL